MTQPQPKIIFFDIDETLYINREEKRVPESTKTALRLLKQKGIITAIATGRTIAVLPEKTKEVVAECGIDMIVSINGQYVQYQDKPLATFAMDKTQVTTLSGSLKQHNIAHAFVTHEGLFTALENHLSQSAMASLGLPYAHQPDIFNHVNVYQFLVFYTTQQDDAVAPLLPENLQIIRWHEKGTDWLDKSGSKARGIQAALDKLGLTMADAMAFGDAHNDAEMLKAVGLGVAMGNAEPEIKAIADYVCPAIDDDGIYRGLVDLGVIEQ